MRESINRGSQSLRQPACMCHLNHSMLPYPVKRPSLGAANPAAAKSGCFLPSDLSGEQSCCSSSSSVSSFEAGNGVKGGVLGSPRPTRCQALASGVSNGSPASQNNINCSSSNDISYELSEDLRATEIGFIERCYGGRIRAQHAARVIQRAYRDYRLRKDYARLCRVQRMSRRLEPASCRGDLTPKPLAVAPMIAAAPSSSSSATGLEHLDDLVLDKAYSLDWDSKNLGVGHNKIRKDAMVAGEVTTESPGDSSYSSGHDGSRDSGVVDGVEESGPEPVTAAAEKTAAAVATSTTAMPGAVQPGASCAQCARSMPPHSTLVYSCRHPAVPGLRRSSSGNEATSLPMHLTAQAAQPQYVLKSNGTVCVPVAVRRPMPQLVSSNGQPMLLVPHKGEQPAMFLVHHHHHPQASPTKSPPSQAQPSYVHHHSHHQHYSLQHHHHHQTQPAPHSVQQPPQQQQQPSADKHRKRIYRIGLNIFNKNPCKGVEFLVRRGFLKTSPSVVAQFLLTRRGLSRSAIGDYLGNTKDELAQATTKQFMRSISFVDQAVDEALRSMMCHFRTPGEAQKIQNLLTEFHNAYIEQNAARVNAQFRSPETVMLLAYAVVMLHTDMYSSSIRAQEKMTKEQFIHNLRNVDCEHDLDHQMLSDIYDRIREGEMSVLEDHTDLVRKIENSLTGPLRPRQLTIPQRRLVCYCRLYEVPDRNKRERQGAHERDVYLFNDMLLVTKAMQKKRKDCAIAYQVKCCIDLLGAKVATFDSECHPYGVELRSGPTTASGTPGQLLVSLNTKTSADRKSFVADLQECIQEVTEMNQIRIEGELAKNASPTKGTPCREACCNRVARIPASHGVPVARHLSSVAAPNFTPSGAIPHNTYGPIILGGPGHVQLINGDGRQVFVPAQTTKCQCSNSSRSCGACHHTAQDHVPGRPSLP